MNYLLSDPQVNQNGDPACKDEKAFHHSRGSKKEKGVNGEQAGGLSVARITPNAPPHWMHCMYGNHFPLIGLRRRSFVFGRP